MAYTDITAIQGEFKSVTFSATTAVTTDDIARFISEEEAFLDAHVGTIYTTPVTGTEALKIMKLMSTLLVKARILDILEVKTGKTDEDQGGGAAEKLRDRILNEDTGILSLIKKKLFLLSDATLVSSSGGVSSYTQSNSLTSQFQKGVDQW